MNIQDELAHLLSLKQIPKTCQTCKQETFHDSHTTVWHQPSISIILINRFQHLGDVVRKVHSTMYCSPIISLPGFAGELIAFIEHTGEGVTSGHYTSYVRSANSWFFCNDDRVSINNSDHIFHSNKSYILFYHKLVPE